MKDTALFSTLLAVAMLCPAVNAQTTSLDFDGAPLPAGIVMLGDAEIRSAGGNPATGGYLKVTDAANGQRGTVIFPDLSGNGLGQLIFSGRTGGANAAHHIDNILVEERADGFSIGADLRVGGGTDRPADGFSFNFARPSDPVLQVDAGGNRGAFAASPAGETNLPEEGTQTGLAIGFDEWQSGPADPNATATNCGDFVAFDCIGMSIRIDNELFAQIAFPTLNGELGDITSLQTGPRVRGGGLDGLGWSRLDIDVTGASGGNFLGSNVAISYKGTQVFNQVIPEPASISLLGLGGLFGVGALRRRRQ